MVLIILGVLEIIFHSLKGLNKLMSEIICADLICIKKKKKRVDTDFIQQKGRHAAFVRQCPVTLVLFGE